MPLLQSPVPGPTHNSREAVLLYEVMAQLGQDRQKQGTAR